MRDRPLIVKLEPVACYNLLSQATVGRVAASMGALPAIRTVRFALDDDQVVFRVAPDSQLRRAVSNAVVAFSADHCDDSTRSGWSVWVQGMCGEILDTNRLGQLEALALPTWSPSHTEDVFMSIPIERMSGETISW